MLSLYNYVSHNEDPNDIFPEGTYMAILAPYMKHAEDDPSKNPLLRCDNPECIRIFSSRRSWLAAKRGKKFVDTEGWDPSLLKEQGNDAFKEDRFALAARCYSQALECRETINPVDQLACLANLAEVRLRQELWEEAEVNARAALALDPTHSKARFRLAVALIRLLKIQEGLHALGDERGKAFQRQRQEIEILIQEQAGVYNLDKMRREAANRPGERLATFHGNFSSNMIQRSVLTSKSGNSQYRGIVATESIGSNVLVSSSKALVFCPPRTDSFGIAFNPYSSRISLGSQLDLEKELVLLMHQRPQIREHVYSLSAGLECSSKDQSNKIDIGRLERIVNTNTFATLTGDELVLHWEKCCRVQRSLAAGQATSNEVRRGETGTGLWANESLFNHSCTRNCTMTQIGDQIFIWTTKEIQSGEELTISYVPDDTSFKEREEKFKDWTHHGIGFQCHCGRCNAVRSSTELKAADERVSQAYKDASELVSTQSIKLAIAAERVLPSPERKKLLRLFSTLPLGYQHYPGLQLWTMVGACEAARGNREAALRAHQKAAEIGYAVRGGYSVGWAKDQWKIAGASMACNNAEAALEVLCSIYTDVVLRSGIEDTKKVFRGLTLEQSLSWWDDSYCPKRVATMNELITKTIKSCRWNR
jgi:tetratricopeptide (TPR) repeat protein